MLMAGYGTKNWKWLVMVCFRAEGQRKLGWREVRVSCCKGELALGDDRRGREAFVFSKGAATLDVDL